ncbi:MAG: hypothetical protein N4A40_12525 [Tissierellales bacterium]|jgi:hypothetical protein|nr:hypothetical protein [Tissierellales bacterium]
MKKYTQEEYNKFEMDDVNNIRFCPTGDYSNIKLFDRCEFGDGCKFGEHSIFGFGCTFGSGCEFGGYSNFAQWCEFDENCTFERNCNFSLGGSFGNGGSFGVSCEFASNHNFGSNCDFENRRVKNGSYIAVEGIGIKRKIYFFADENKELFVRCDVFFGTSDEWLGDIKNSEFDSKFISNYTLALELAKIELLD